MTTAAEALAEIMATTRAIFSEDDAHRLWLSRARPHELVERSMMRILFVLLNPSTGGLLNDDMTITKCVGFSRSLAATDVGIVNLFSAVSTNPDRLPAMGERANEARSDLAILAALHWLGANGKNGRRVVFAYGKPLWAGNAIDGNSIRSTMLREQAKRIAFVRDAARAGGFEPFALGTTADDWPRHPSRFGYFEPGSGAHIQPVPPEHYASLGI